MRHTKEPFERCPNCHKYILPPGLIIVLHSTNAPDRFCDTNGSCARIECPGCGFYINPLYHSQWECNFSRKAYGWQGKTLDSQEVLCEAEAILREAREQ